MSDLKDPRVFFAAERTLLAWNRTSLALMAFGFMIERFGLFVEMMLPEKCSHFQRGESFWVGIAFILVSVISLVVSCLQYRKILKTLNHDEIPDGYMKSHGMALNLFVALMGFFLSLYLFMSIT